MERLIRKKDREERNDSKEAITKKGKKERKHPNSSDDSETGDDMNLSNILDVEYEEEFDMCPSCNKGDQHSLYWITCDVLTFDDIF